MNNGFSLIELLITLFIISVLISIGYPIYSNHVVTERRLEAAGMLSKLAIALEEYRIEHNSYQDATFQRLHFPQMIAEKNYQLNIQTITAYSYRLIANPLGKQAEKDKNCGSLILHSNGEKSITGPGELKECW